MKTKKEFFERYEELKSQAESLKLTYKTNREVWRKSNYADDKAYKDMLDAEREMTRAEHDSRFYGMLAGDKPIYANQHFYTDVEPWEVVEIKTDRLLIVRPMKATIKAEARKALQESFVPGGFLGHFDNSAQDWIYESDPTAGTAEIRRHKDGSFHLAGDSTIFLLSESPRKYYDYNF